MKRLVLLGSTGSIGRQTLDVVKGLNLDGDFPLKLEVLAAKSNIDLLEAQTREFKPKAVAIFDERAAKEFRIRTRDLEVEVLCGMDGLCQAASYVTADIVLNSVVGMIGLKPTLAAIAAKKQIALANKETLVAGGSLVMRAAKENNVNILPVDSEHSAIFQCLEAAPENHRFKKIILTASGGAFFGKSSEDLKNVSLKEALKHPNWDMGAKITVDSASLMNKGLEIIEAAWLFDAAPEQIDVVIHRESIIHSLVEFEDNAVLAQLGLPDMQIPIQYALTYPRRFKSPAGELKLTEIGGLSFFEPDYEAFDCLAVCKEALKRGGLYPAAINGANEAAVELFIDRKIAFTDIAVLVRSAMNNQKECSQVTLETVLEADAAARRFVRHTVGIGV